MHQKDNPQKPSTKVKRTKEEVLTTLENKKKAAIDFPRHAFKRKNIVEEGTWKHIFEKNDEAQSGTIYLVVRAMPPVV